MLPTRKGPNMLGTYKVPFLFPQNLLSLPHPALRIVSLSPSFYQIAHFTSLTEVHSLLNNVSL